MSISYDEYMSVLNQFQGLHIVGSDIIPSCSYRIILVTLSVGVEALTADKVTRLMADFGCFYLESDTIEDQPFCVVECIVEHEFAIYIIDAGEPEIGNRFKWQVTIIEGDGHIDDDSTA